MDDTLSRSTPRKSSAREPYVVQLVVAGYVSMAQPSAECNAGTAGGSGALESSVGTLRPPASSIVMGTVRVKLLTGAGVVVLLAQCRTSTEKVAGFTATARHSHDVPTTTVSTVAFVTASVMTGSSQRPCDAVRPMVQAACSNESREVEKRPTVEPLRAVHVTVALTVTLIAAPTGRSVRVLPHDQHTRHSPSAMGAVVVGKL